MTWLLQKLIVVPIDFSNDSFTSLNTALGIVDDPAHVCLLHVLPVLEAADPGVIWDVLDDDSRSEHVIKALRKELQKRGMGELQVVVRIGDPGHEIVQYAEQVKAGMIVVASRGQSTLERLLIGSVAERIVRLAHCAVLVLKHD